MVLIYKEDNDEINVEELEQSVQEIKRVKEQQKQLEDTVAPAKQKIKEQFGKEDVNKWLSTQYGNEVDILKEISKNLQINLTEATDYCSR